MPVPDFQQFMLPLLKELVDGKEHRLRDLEDRIANHFSLTEEDKQELLPSGRQAIFKNRIGWARTYMKKAGLLDTPKRATLCITKRGLHILHQDISAINVKFLKQFPEFVAFHETKRDDRSNSNAILPTDNQEETPEELLETAYQTIRDSLAQEIIAKLFPCLPRSLSVSLLNSS